MTMMAFHTLFPEEARNESRAITMVGHEVLRIAPSSSWSRTAWSTHATAGA
jgi:hypothetical protein